MGSLPDSRPHGVPPVRSKNKQHEIILEVSDNTHTIKEMVTRSPYFPKTQPQPSQTDLTRNSSVVATTSFKNEIITEPSN